MKKRLDFNQIKNVKTKLLLQNGIVVLLSLITFALVIFSFFRIENANTAGLHVDE